MTKMRILWLQELARREAERQFIENRDLGSLDPLTGVFGIVGRRFERVEESNGDDGGARSRGGRGVGFPEKGSTHVVENLGLAIGEGPRSRKEQQPKLTESGREALELLRRAPERRVEDLSRVLLMPTGELGRVVNRKPLLQGTASTRQLADLGGWVAQLTPSYSRNVRSKSTRPLDTKFQPFLPLTLGGEESEKARRAQDKDKLVLDPQALAARQPPPPLTLLKGLRHLQSKDLLSSPRSLGSFALSATPPSPETGPPALSSIRPGTAGSDVTALTSATNATGLTAISGLTGLGGRSRRGRGRSRSRSRSPSPALPGAKSKAQSQSAALSAEHREGVLHTMPLLLRNKVAARQERERSQRRQEDLDGFESVDVGMGTRSPGGAGLGTEPEDAGCTRARPANADATFSGAVAERGISTPFPSIDAPALVSPPPLLLPNSLELAKMGEYGKPSRGLALPGAHPSPLLVPARFRDDGSLSGSGSASGGEDSGPESAYTFSPVFIAQQHLDDGRVEALVKESLRLRARLARDEARAAGSARPDIALDEWVDGGPFPPGLVPSGLVDVDAADSWVSGESLSPSFLLQRSSSMQSASTNTSNANKPQLVLPPLLVLLEALYISKNSGAKTGRSVESRPRWGGAGTKARRGKEQDAKYFAETMPT